MKDTFVHAWMVAGRLLEDEEDQIRSDLAVFVSQVFPTNSMVKIL
jgi:hypothetical protein